MFCYFLTTTTSSNILSSSQSSCNFSKRVKNVTGQLGTNRSATFSKISFPLAVYEESQGSELQIFQFLLQPPPYGFPRCDEMWSSTIAYCPRLWVNCIVLLLYPSWAVFLKKIFFIIYQYQYLHFILVWFCNPSFRTFFFMPVIRLTTFDVYTRKSNPLCITHNWSYLIPYLSILQTL